MSTRERWIVYPLLFLTLGMGLRDWYQRKVVPPAQFQASQIVARQIQCNTLHVGQILCDRLESVQSVCRKLVVNGSSGRPIVAAGEDIRNHNGLVEVFSAKGFPLVQLQSTKWGGMVSTISRAGKAVVMGYLGEQFGVFGQLPGTDLIVPLTQTWRFGPKGTPVFPKKDQTPESPSAKQSPAKPSENKEARPSGQKK